MVSVLVKRGGDEKDISFKKEERSVNKDISRILQNAMSVFLGQI